MLNPVVVSEQLEVYEVAIKQLTIAFNEFVGECLLDGKPKAPSMQALYKARGCLPSWCSSTIVKPKTEKS